MRPKNNYYTNIMLNSWKHFIDLDNVKKHLDFTDNNCTEHCPESAELSIKIKMDYWDNEDTKNSN